MNSAAVRDMAITLAAFLRTRWLARRLKSRADVEAFQARRLKVWLAGTVSRRPYYRALAPADLSGLPVIDKRVMMDNFHQFNALGLTHQEAARHFHAQSHPPGVHVGASTGTSGNRGYYVISPGERAEWLGVMLGKLLPRFPFEKARVAIILPQNAALYRQPGRSRRLVLRFFDLNAGLEQLPAALDAFMPDTLVAPPKVLRYLADQPRRFRATRLFSGAEVLDPVDRGHIERGFSIRPGEIYMATEGLLGVTCGKGRLHLAEDVMHFEFEPGPEGSGLVNPVITDFTRRLQVMARYRMNDLLLLSRNKCPCGSPFQVVDAVAGRMDDVLLLPARCDGHSVPVTPDILRNAIVDAGPAIEDFRCVQTESDHVGVILPETLAEEVEERVRAGLAALFLRLGLCVRLTVRRDRLDIPLVKLRRVQRVWTGEAGT